MKKLPIGIQSLPELINGGYIYVDKTKYIHKLVTTNKVYFLSRPRRFGKSLLVSALKELFKGNKELFKGLWIYDKIEWRQYPVIHIDFSQIRYKEKGLREALTLYLYSLAKENRINLECDEYSGMFPELIQKISVEKQVAILIDEYDKPIIDYLTDTEKAKENRDILKSLYGCLKGLDEHIRFLFITGVSKFSKVSIFSDLNHLLDITIDREYSSMLGYTEDEISINFEDYLLLAEKNNQVTRSGLRKEMKRWYNGYNWHIKSERVYNPFSILNFFQKLDFSNYWFATGTPTFIVEFLKKQKTLPEQTENILVNQLFFDKFDIEHLDIFSLMFQTGYLTMMEADNDGGILLSFPNFEVENSFLTHLIECYSHSVLSETTQSLQFIKMGLKNNDWSRIVSSLNILFASIPYQLYEGQSEFFYHAIIHTALSLMGVDLHSEMQTSKGRIDTVIKTEKFIYIVEFKMGDAKNALRQIIEKEYHKPFIHDGRLVVMVGVGFDKKKKEIKTWISESIT